MSVKTVANENILKLRELADKICKTSPITDESKLLKDLKNVLEEGKEEVSLSETPNSKLKCYEEMCVKINNILNNKIKNA